METIVQFVQLFREAFLLPAMRYTEQIILMSAQFGMVLRFIVYILAWLEVVLRSCTIPLPSSFSFWAGDPAVHQEFPVEVDVDIAAELV